MKSAANQLPISLRFHEQLLRFQLFQGLSRSELLQMTGHTKFGFLKLAAGKTLVHEGDLCQQLYFLVGGSLTLTTAADDSSYYVVEQLSAPWLLQPEVLFGARTRYVSTVKTATDAHFITLTKDEMLRLFDDFLIVRLNFLNLLSTQAQRHSRKAWRRAPRSLRERIVMFLLDHAVYPAGFKEYHILMVRLAQALGCSRHDVSAALNQMQADGLLQLHRGRIVVPSVEHLLM